ncbi:MAG: hydroxymethylbilane synthase [Minwuia sp.]|uniref:hydroxymethylbilane synthase n=1 Tax=Minwuia sp. TaxID=2493630 RepID=UPI003A878CDA
MNEQASIRIGTRGSPLALWQANEVKRRLHAAHDDLPDEAVEIVVITTTGDRIRDRALAALGGKGLFTKEIEESLHAGDIDLAVHSMKDMPTELPDGLEISCLLPREDPRDAFLSNIASGIADLPEGVVVGTASLRRQAQLLFQRPDLKVITFRGNVDTRIAKLDAGDVAATFLANAGLRRLERTERITAVIEPEEMLPAVAQGAVGVEIRSNDDATRARLAPLHDVATEHAVTAERAMLAALDGSCRTPIAGLALPDGEGGLWLRAEIVMPDGSERRVTERRGSTADAFRMGDDAGAELKRQAGPAFLAEIL